jgi:UDP-glucose 4-epimerase
VYGNPEKLPVTENMNLNPISPYGVAKISMEKYLHMFGFLNGIQYLIIRPSNAYGPRQNFLGQQGVVGIFLNKLEKKEEINIWGTGSIEKDYVYVADLAKAVVKLIKSGFDNDIYNIGSNKGISINSLLLIMNAVTGKTSKINYRDEKTYDVKNIILSNRKLENKINWVPSTSLIDGIKNTYEWYKSISNINK